MPILGIPAQMAQNFTNLLPAGSIPRMVAQNATNLLSTVTDVSQTLDLNTGELHVGLPLVLALDAIGPPVTTLEAIWSSATAFFGAAQTGDGLGALAALIDAPAVAANGFLNGQAAVGLPALLGGPGPDGILTITAIPLGGILTPPQTASLSIPLLGPGSLPLSGTGFGGALPALLTFLPQTLAQAIGAPRRPDPHSSLEADSGVRTVMKAVKSPVVFWRGHHCWLRSFSSWLLGGNRPRRYRAGGSLSNIG